MENGGNCTVRAPLLTVMMMFDQVPVLPADGVPYSVPYFLPNEAQAGLFLMLKCKVRPPACATVGVNE